MAARKKATKKKASARKPAARKKVAKKTPARKKKAATGGKKARRRSAGPALTRALQDAVKAILDVADEIQKQQAQGSTLRNIGQALSSWGSEGESSGS